MRNPAQTVEGSSNSAAVVASEDATMSGRNDYRDANSSATSDVNNETCTTKLPSRAGNSGNSRRLCISGSSAPHHCQDNIHAAPLNRRQDCEADETQTVVCLPVFADSQRCASAVTQQDGPSVGNSDVTDGRADVMDDDDEEEAWTTTSGSYSAGDLCDEIDQLFFAHNSDKSFVSSK